MDEGIQKNGLDLLNEEQKKDEREKEKNKSKK